MTTQLSYGERLLTVIMEQCETRGIPVEESESFMAHIAQVHGKRVTEMNAPEMKKVQQNLDGLFRSYLGGEKRREGPGSRAWPADVSPEDLLRTARGGISISSEEE